MQPPTRNCALEKLAAAIALLSAQVMRMAQFQPGASRSERAAAGWLESANVAAAQWTGARVG